MIKKEKKEVKEVEVVEKVATKADPRMADYLAFLENYKKQNPVKYAAKEANGDFKDIPASFGKKV